MKSIKVLGTSSALLVALVIFMIIGLFSRQVVSFNSRVFSSETKLPQVYHQLEDPEYEFMNSLRFSALASTPNQKHTYQIVSNPSRKDQTQLFLSGSPNSFNNKNNNEPDVAELLQQNANRQARLQRSLNTNNNNERVSPSTLTTNQLQMYQDEQSFKRQLPDLIAQAHNDKVFERALLRMLINSSLSGSRNNANNFPRDSLTSNGPIINGDSSVEGNENALSKVQQAALDNYASLDPFVNDIGKLSQQEGELTPMDKREYNKPCLFNAIACPKNPFGRMHDI